MGSMPRPQPAAIRLAGLFPRGGVRRRIYAEGIDSERTASAAHLTEPPARLRKAIETGDARAAKAAARELLAPGHLTTLDVRSARGTLVSVGGEALTPLRGTILGASGAPIATYMTSVWAVGGFVAEGSRVAEGLVALRAGGRAVGGTIELPRGPLLPEGSLARNGVVYQYTSFTGRTYPTGSVQIYLLKPLPAGQALRGPSGGDTQLATLRRV